MGFLKTPFALVTLRSRPLGAGAQRVLSKGHSLKGFPLDKSGTVGISKSIMMVTN
jgi:hypothetical protein